MWVNGRDTKDPNELMNVRQSAGMVFQNPDNQIIGTVVEEDVGFGPENLGVPTDEIWKRVEDSLKAVGMLEYRKNSPNKLSGGQKQRVAIAGVIAMHPKCIIMDEPTTALDVVVQREIIEEISELRRDKGFSVIFITHDLPMLLEITDKIAVMKDGVIVDQGVSEDVYFNPKHPYTQRLLSSFPSLTGDRGSFVRVPRHA